MPRDCLDYRGIPEDRFVIPKVPGMVWDQSTGEMVPIIEPLKIRIPWYRRLFGRLTNEERMLLQWQKTEKHLAYVRETKRVCE